MRLKEIEERLAAIKNELTTRAAELKEEEITALENEVTALQEERAAIKAAAEKRSALLARIAAGESVGDGEGDGSGQQRVLRNFKGAAGEGDNDDKYGSMEYRKAFMKYVCRGEALPKEYRADAVSKSTDVGAVIPTTVLNQIVEKLESTGMILALVTRTAYKGGVSIPVSTVKPTATWVNEGAGSDKQKKNIAKDGMITFAYHKLRCAVAVSLEVDTMAISAFETLLINNIVEAMTKALRRRRAERAGKRFAIKRKAGFMNMTITEFIEAAAHNKIIQLVVLAIVCDTVFGVLRAIKEKKFNSCAGIDGAIRKVGMLISLVFMLAIDVLIKINLIGFIPEQARTYLGLDTVGVAEFFALLYIAYEVVSIFKNMALCGLPVKKVWEKVREFLAKYTDELPDTDELDGDSTTGNVEEHRTQER